MNHQSEHQQIDMLMSKLSKLCKKHDMKEPQRPGSLAAAKTLLANMEDEIAEKESNTRQEKVMAADDYSHRKDFADGEACEACGSGSVRGCERLCLSCKNNLLAHIEGSNKTIKAAGEQWCKEHKIRMSYKSIYKLRSDRKQQLQKPTREELFQIKKDKVKAIMEAGVPIAAKDAAQRVTDEVAAEYGVESSVGSVENMIYRVWGSWPWCKKTGWLRNADGSMRRVKARDEAQQSITKALDLEAVCAFVLGLSEMQDLAKVRESLEAAESAKLDDLQKIAEMKMAEYMELEDAMKELKQYGRH